MARPYAADQVPRFLLDLETVYLLTYLLTYLLNIAIVGRDLYSSRRYGKNIATVGVK